MNILITRHDKIGDFITTLPLFYVVKRHYPSASIFALVSKVNFDLAKQAAFIDEVILHDKDNLSSTLKRIKKAKIDISISAFIDTQLGLLLWRSGIPRRVAPATKLAQLFFNKTLKQRRSRVEKTEFEYNLDLAKVLDRDINLNFERPLIKLENNQFFRNKHALKDKKIVLFHPGYGGSSAGNLDLQDYIKLADATSQIDNVQVVWTFGPDDLVAKSKIQQLADTSHIVYQPDTLLEFCYLINDSELIVSTSTGPMHLAGALNKKTISFFSDNLFASPKRWATVSETNKQNNFLVNEKLKRNIIKNKMVELC